MLPLEKRPSGGVGLFLIATAHVYGWGFPRGGSQRLADALADRLRELGGEIRTHSRVDELPKADVVLADVVPRELLRIAGDRLPARYAHALRRYRYGPGVFKLDWALDGPIPWAAEECRRAATVHLGGSFEELADRSAPRGKAGTPSGRSSCSRSSRSSTTRAHRPGSTRRGRTAMCRTARPRT